MSKIERNIVIKRPAQELFDYLENVENAKQYLPNVVEARQTTSGAVAVDTLFRIAVGFMRQQIRFEVRVTEHDRPHRLAVRVIEGPIQGEAAFTLESPAGTDDGAGGGTRATFTAEAPKMEGALGRLGEQMIFQELGREAESALRKIKQAMEA